MTTTVPPFESGTLKQPLIAVRTASGDHKSKVSLAPVEWSLHEEDGDCCCEPMSIATVPN